MGEGKGGKASRKIAHTAKHLAPMTHRTLLSLLLMLALVAPMAAQTPSYNLPSVCAGTTERYGMMGTNGHSTFNWVIVAPNGEMLPSERYVVMGCGDSIDVRWGADLPPGLYTFLVTERSNMGCWGTPYRQEVLLNTPEIFIPIGSELADETGFCLNGTSPLALDPGEGFISYLWQDSTTNQLYYTGEAGTFTVRLTQPYTYIMRSPDDGVETTMRTYTCSYDSVRVHRWAPPHLNLGRDTMIGPHESLLIDAYPRDTVIRYPNLIYNWSTGDISSDITVYGADLMQAPSHGQTFWVTVEEEHGCQASDSITVMASSMDGFRIPAAFTPNGDGFNDTWVFPAPNAAGLSVRDYIEEVDVKVFDRHGRMVWKHRGLPHDWDGRALNGKPLPMDSYHYLIKVQFNGHTYDFKGSVTIVR